MCVCVYTRARKGAVVVVVVKRRRRDTKGKVYSFLIPIVFCVVTASTSFKEISFPPPDGEIER